jgi:dihydroorotase-like cyclic amidohydrolase
MISLTPAQMIKKNSGLIEVGRSADLVLFDVNAKSVVQNEQSLYKNEELDGKIISVFVAGKLK